MARQYPRFLFANPQNTKSKGPFIIHTMAPRIICKVYSAPIEERAPNFVYTYYSENFAIGVFDEWEAQDLWGTSQVETYVPKLLIEMNEWLKAQIIAGEVNL